MQDKIESRIYVGTFDGRAIAFADKNYKKAAFNKGYSYKLEGAMCIVDMEVYENIKKQYDSQNKNYATWATYVYVDFSSKEVERLKSEYIRDGRRYKIINTLKEFDEGTFDSAVCIYLKNIIPLNCYVNVDNPEGRFDFCKKRIWIKMAIRIKIMPKPLLDR